MTIEMVNGVVTKVAKPRKASKSAAEPATEKPPKLALVKGYTPEPKTPAKARKPKTPKPAVVETPAPEVSAPAPVPPSKATRKAKSFDAELDAVAEHAESLKGLADAFAGKLVADGKTAGTVASYKNELNLALTHFGPNARIGDLTKASVLEYFTSKRVMKLRSGRSKSQLSIDKSRRVLRQALTWAHQQGLVAELLVPEMPAAS